MQNAAAKSCAKVLADVKLTARRRQRLAVEKHCLLLGAKVRLYEVCARRD